MRGQYAINHSAGWDLQRVLERVGNGGKIPDGDLSEMEYGFIAMKTSE